jgi:hypothetical protein
MNWSFAREGDVIACVVSMLTWANPSQGQAGSRLSDSLLAAAAAMHGGVVPPESPPRIGENISVVNG